MALLNYHTLRRRLVVASKVVMRFGLALVLIWIGAMKYTEYEASGIKPLVENSPLMSWLYDIFSVSGFAALLGAFEITIGVLIALGFAAGRLPVLGKLSALGSALAGLMFLGTLSFIFSTPGWEPSLGGFPALSVAPGQFLLKDIVLLGASLWTAADSLEMAR
ncbi:DUF417 family protein [Persicimonas caeni]|uniref:DUF417 family protein n=1 Tax=Persicimonas caeni TaxID=2292766 RepID=A0A4Y6PQU1_PERCE|nr:DUF417 family protein [Persicimonas caeni]QDG50593.1 DUF417 family protein [Persicimonas caeni]QED31814.1 DUF417 family protein [Persicimonas caeni]